MDTKCALAAFAALSQETRLAALRLLVLHGRSGMAAGLLASALEVPHNTLSFHLSHLQQAGLVQSVRRGRHIVYAADLEAVRALSGFLMENCCKLENSADATIGGSCPC
ncbi:MAG: helix-turn-helix transcriptional regulator [Magnetococcales bacterium]|nr:helix-turn-helix transcriptional regulator [Magnetococcales bacterium]